MYFSGYSNVNIKCIEDRSCMSSKFDVSKSISLHFIASEVYAARYLDLYVPSNGKGPYKDEIVTTLNFLTNVYSGDDLSIYAFEGFNDFLINTQYSDMLYDSYVYCGPYNYNYSCQIDHTNDAQSCIDTTVKGSDCGTWKLGTYEPTSEPTTSSPTPYPTFLIDAVINGSETVAFCDEDISVTCTIGDNIDKFSSIRYEWIINDNNGTVSSSICNNTNGDLATYSSSIDSETLNIPRSCIDDKTIDSNIKFVCIVNGTDVNGHKVNAVSDTFNVFRESNVTVTIDLNSGTNGYEIQKNEDSVTIGLSDNLVYHGQCQQEISAYKTYVTHSYTYSWTQFTSWSDERIYDPNYLGSSPNTIRDELGWDDIDAATLTSSNLLTSNGYSSPYNKISITIDVENTVNEGEYYLFFVSFTTTNSESTTETIYDYVGIYISPTQVTSNYQYISKNEIETNDTIRYDLTSFFEFPINDNNDIMDRYQIDFECISADNDGDCNDFDASISDNVEIDIKGADLEIGATYYVNITVNDTYYDELDIVSTQLRLKIVSGDSFAVSLSLVSGSTSSRFNKNSKITLEASITTSADHDVSLIYSWKDLNGILDFSEKYSFLTPYKNKLIIDGSLDTTNEYIYSNAQYNIEFTVNASDNSIASGTSNIMLEVNDAPSNGTCNISIDGETGDLTNVYALTSDVTIKCFNWYDQDSVKYYRFDVNDGTSTITIRSKMAQNEHTFSLGYGNYTLYAYIYDTLGASTKYTIGEINTKIDLDSDSATILSNIESYLSENLYEAAASGDTSSMAMATMAAVSLLDYLGDNDEDGLLDELRNQRTLMLTSIITTFEYDLEISENNIETESSLINTVVRSPTQIANEIGQTVMIRIGALMDSGSNITQDSINDDTANAIAQSIIAVSKAFIEHQNDTNGTDSNSSVVSTQTVIALTLAMTEILMIDKLRNALPGESGYSYVSSDVTLSGARIDTETQINDDGSMDTCATGNALEYNQMGNVIENRTNDSSVDCLFSQTPYTLWNDVNGERLYSTNIISLEFTLSINDRTFDRESIISSVLTENNDEVRRRRLASLTDEEMAKLNITDLDTCDVFVFLMYHNTDSNFTDWTSEDVNTIENVSLPICRYYDTTNETWTSDGCWAVFSNNTLTKCACTHLSSFSISASDFVPTINTIDITQLRAITWENIQSHPNAIVISTCVIFLFWMIMLCLPHENDKPMLAQLRPWSQLQHKKWPKFIVKKQNTVLLYDASLCEKLLRWFWIYLRNNHPILAICFRDYGTNWSGPQRVFCFLASVLTMAAVNGMYYGHAGYTYNAGAILNAMYASISGSTVPVLLSFFFGYHTPAMATTKYDRPWDKVRYQYKQWQHRRRNLNNNKDELLSEEEQYELDERQIELDILGLLTNNDLEQIHKATQTHKIQNLKLKRKVTKTEALFNENELEKHFVNARLSSKKTNRNNNNNKKNKNRVSVFGGKRKSAVVATNNNKQRQNNNSENIQSNEASPYATDDEDIENGMGAGDTISQGTLTRTTTLALAKTDSIKEMLNQRINHTTSFFGQVNETRRKTLRGNQINLDEFKDDYKNKNSNNNNNNNNNNGFITIDNDLSPMSPSDGDMMNSSTPDSPNDVNDKVGGSNKEMGGSAYAALALDTADFGGIENAGMVAESKAIGMDSDEVSIKGSNGDSPNNFDINNMTSTRAKTLREARQLHYKALHESVNFANRMLVPTVVSEQQVSEYEDELNNDDDGNENENENENENKEDENKKEKKKKKKHKKKNKENSEVYFESRELMPEENAALTLVQAHIISYVYWWPHSLMAFGWCCGTVWILICAALVLIYGVNFDLLNELSITDDIEDAATSSETECAYTFEAYDVNLTSLVNYQLSTEYALVNSGNVVDNGWGDVPDTASWFTSFFISTIISLIIFTPLTSFTISTLMYYVYQHLWTPRPKMDFYQMYYKNKKELKDNVLNKFKTEDDLWNGIGLEIDEVALAEHPYWVLDHPYVKELRRQKFFTQFKDDSDDDNDGDDGDDDGGMTAEEDLYNRDDESHSGKENVSGTGTGSGNSNSNGNDDNNNSNNNGVNSLLADKAKLASNGSINVDDDSDSDVKTDGNNNNNNNNNNGIDSGSKGSKKESRVLDLKSYSKHSSQVESQFKAGVSMKLQIELSSLGETNPIFSEKTVSDGNSSDDGDNNNNNDDNNNEENDIKNNEILSDIYSETIENETGNDIGQNDNNNNNNNKSGNKKAMSHMLVPMNDGKGHVANSSTKMSFGDLDDVLSNYVPTMDMMGKTSDREDSLNEIFNSVMDEQDDDNNDDNDE